MDPSLCQLGLSHVDFYLVPHPSTGLRDVWSQMEHIRDVELARSIGVANFNVDQLTELLEHAKYVPAVNQVRPSYRQ
jgi:diketogulonate reductase-like aldo/keto reductase